MFVLFLCLIFLYNSSYAIETNSSLIKAYKVFLIKLETKIESKENQLVILQKIKTKIDTTLKSKKLSTKSIILLKELGDINNIQIKKVKSKIDNTYDTTILKTETPIINIESKNYNDIDYLQIELEKKYRQKFTDSKNSFSLPTYISNILSTNKKYLYTIQDNENHIFEFLDNNIIKRILFTNYYEVTENNYNLFSWKNWYILNYNWKYIFIENYEIEDKIPYSESYNLFKWVIINSWSTFYKSNSDYNYYKFQNFSYIKDDYWFYTKNLNSLWFDVSKTILYKNWTNYAFINNFTEVKLINFDIIKNITNKDLFLKSVYDDKKNLTHETDKYFLELKNITENLTTWLTKEEKINKIYDYILKNITYTNPIDLNKKEIFSWIDTYKNKDWVCEWYVKLMTYMLMFAWIEDVEVIRWFVINAMDFPKVWHAWLRIEDYYYDPTFDDPIWNTVTKTSDDYDYYKLPLDLFYTNRYNLSDLPESLKTKSNQELEEIVNKNLYNLVTKYKNSWYNLIKYSLMLYNNWLSYNDPTISELTNLIVTYEVNWSDMTFLKDWKKINIKKFNYYKLLDSNIKDILKTIKYDLNNKYIFKWDLWNGNYEYRLVYELELY